ncbi:MAG: DUF1223 domain-containing protein [Acidobacteria bacterium]|nr:DUF1223 domain-containing protein [Acidobacteriota bacterium]
MRRAAASLALLVLVAVVGFAIRANAPQGPKLGPNPVVVELFTSQGCSSCPPADELLRALAKDPAYAKTIVPLAYHVDYWDHLGWRDPFSSKQYTLRQMMYQKQFGLTSAYTPQAVVGGSKQLVGSQANELRKAILEDSQRASEGKVMVLLRDGQAAVHAESKSSRDLVIVAFQDGAKTQIVQGENRGTTVVNDAIVRQVTRPGAVHDTVVNLPPEATGVAAFLQDRTTMRIYAATVARR